MITASLPLSERQLFPYCIGAVTDAATIAPWNIDVLPDGNGLPEGQGDVATGAEVYKVGYAYCHGENGTGGIKPTPDHVGSPAHTTLLMRLAGL